MSRLWPPACVVTLRLRARAVGLQRSPARSISAACPCGSSLGRSTWLVIHSGWSASSGSNYEPSSAEPRDRREPTDEQQEPDGPQAKRGRNMTTLPDHPRATTPEL